MDQSYLKPIFDLAALLDLGIVSHCQVKPQLEMLEAFTDEEVIGDIVATHVQTLARRASKRGHHDVAKLLGHWHEQRFAVAA